MPIDLVVAIAPVGTHTNQSNLSRFLILFRRENCLKTIGENMKMKSANIEIRNF